MTVEMLELQKELCSKDRSCGGQVNYQENGQVTSVFKNVQTKKESPLD